MSALRFETGKLSQEEIGRIFETLPVDITFVGKDDTVQYFSKLEGRIFARPKGVLGRKVQQCHPAHSLHVVNEILSGFRAGKREAAEFWINMAEKLIHIRYFPVRNSAGEYLGCLEVSQDVTGIRELEGEKRLL